MIKIRPLVFAIIGIPLTFSVSDANQGCCFQFLEQAAPQGLSRPLEKLKITGPSSVHTFEVDVLRTQEQLEAGINFREKKLGEAKGVLFYAGEPARAIPMWTKDILIPIDMIFIDTSGTIVKVAEKLAPQSVQIFSADAPIVAILEIDAGAADMKKIAVGDKVEHSLFVKR